MRAAIGFITSEPGAVHRLRPKLMTVCAVLASLIPILWASGIARSARRLLHRTWGRLGPWPPLGCGRPCTDLLEPRIKPAIIVVSFENDRHSVMNVGQKCICRSCDDRTRFDHLPLRVLPSVPDSSETNRPRGYRRPAARSHRFCRVFQRSSAICTFWAASWGSVNGGVMTVLIIFPRCRWTAIHERSLTR
jgi:hypothetical protein